VSTGPVITRIAPWFGAKGIMAPIIVQELGPHRGYAELFCGSAAVLLNKPRSSMEVLNDLHGDLINLARVLASGLWRDLCERCDRTLMAHELHTEAQAIVAHAGVVAPSIAGVMPEHVDRAYWYLVYSWQGRNGIAGTAKNHGHLARRYTIGGGHGPTRWRGVVHSMPFWHERLASVTIDRLDAFEMLERLDDDGCWAYYLDPPYLEKGAKYTHDFTPAQHADLAALVSRFRKARVVVSYRPHPRLHELYPLDRFHHRLVEVPKNLSVSLRRGESGLDPAEADTATEVLITNGPSLAATSGGLWP